MAERYAIEYAAEAAADLRVLRAFDGKRVLDGIEQYLSFEPQRLSRSRIKLMSQPFWSQYRLRVDQFRVYYDVEGEVVTVLRVLKKGTEPTPESSP